MDIKECEVSAVYQKLHATWNNYLIELSYHPENIHLPEYCNIEIDSYKFYDELMKLKNREAPKIYFSCGMTGIDIFTNDDSYIICSSPASGIYNYFSLNETEYDKLLSALKSTLTPDQEN